MYVIGNSYGSMEDFTIQCCYSYFSCLRNDEERNSYVLYYVIHFIAVQSRISFVE